MLSSWHLLLNFVFNISTPYSSGYVKFTACDSWLKTALWACLKSLQSFRYQLRGASGLANKTAFVFILITKKKKNEIVEHRKPTVLTVFYPRYWCHFILTWTRHHKKNHSTGLLNVILCRNRCTWHMASMVTFTTAIAGEFVSDHMCQKKGRESPQTKIFELFYA